MTLGWVPRVHRVSPVRNEVPGPQWTVWLLERWAHTMPESQRASVVREIGFLRGHHDDNQFEKYSIGLVYFIRTKHREYVKIGVSKDPDHRLYELQCATPDDLELCACIHGGSEIERLLHSVLKDHCVRGEWFHLRSQVTSLIALAKLDRTTWPMKGRWKK